MSIQYVDELDAWQNIPDLDAMVHSGSTNSEFQSRQCHINPDGHEADIFAIIEKAVIFRKTK